MRLFTALCFLGLVILSTAVAQTPTDEMRDALIASLSTLPPNKENLAERCLTVHALSEFSDQHSIRALLNALSDPDALVRAEAMASLDRIASRVGYSSIEVPSAGAFIRALADRSPVVRQMAYSFLKNSMLRFDELVSALESGEQPIRVAAAALVVEKLSLLRSSDEGIDNQEAKEEIKELKNLSLVRLMHDLEDNDARVRCTVTSRLKSGWLGSPTNEQKQKIKEVDKTACREVGEWESVEKANTLGGYQHFANAFPNGLLGEEARKRATDPVRAFLVACQLGAKALEGFATSYPHSDYVTLALAYADFLKARGKNFGALKTYLDANPGTIFSRAAVSSAPLMILKENGATARVFIRVESLEFKGLLYGGRGNADAAAGKIWEDVQKELASQGIQSERVGSSAYGSQDGTGILFVVQYAESLAPPGHDYSSKDILHREAVESLASIFVAPNVAKTTTMSLKNPRDGRDLVGTFHKLSDTVSGLDSIRLLRTEGAGTLARFLLTLPLVDLMDSQQLGDAEEILASLQRGRY